MNDYITEKFNDIDIDKYKKLDFLKLLMLRKRTLGLVFYQKMIVLTHTGTRIEI